LLNTESEEVPRGVPVRYQVPIQPVGVTLPAGHRLRVAIYSADPAVHEPLAIPAINTVFHDPGYRSVLRVTTGTRPDHSIVSSTSVMSCGITSHSPQSTRLDSATTKPSARDRHETRRMRCKRVRIAV
jgi:hypothetical protein